MHKKIQKIIEEADLPPEQTNALRRELESHFYEKELDLELSGIPKDKIQAHLEEDFGDESFVANYFKFVYKKSFYHFIASLMKNKYKPSIFWSLVAFVFGSVLFLFILNLLYNWASIGGLSPDYSLAYIDVDFIFLLLGVLFIFNFAIVVRLFLGKSILQKLASVFLFIGLMLQFGLAYSVISQIYELRSTLPDPYQILLNTKSQVHESSYFENLTGGYSMVLDGNFAVYLKDGSQYWVQDLEQLNLDSESDYFSQIASVGPLYASDEALIDIEVYDSVKASDKSSDETWFDYYLARLDQAGLSWSEIDAQIIMNDYEGYIVYDDMRFSDGTSILSGEDSIYTVKTIKLSEPQRGKVDVLLVEYFDRLYVFTYDSKNLNHLSILFDQRLKLFVPEDRYEWVTFDHPSCPFRLELPTHWFAQKESANSEAMGSEIKMLDFKDIENCDLDGFNFEQSSVSFQIEYERVQGFALDEYFKNNSLDVLREADTQWSGRPAKQILFDLDGYSSSPILAIQLGEEDWLLFKRLPSRNPDDFQTKVINRILSSIEIKSEDESS